MLENPPILVIGPSPLELAKNAPKPIWKYSPLKKGHFLIAFIPPCPPLLSLRRGRKENWPILSRAWDGDSAGMWKNGPSTSPGIRCLAVSILWCASVATKPREACMPVKRIPVSCCSVLPVLRNSETCMWHDGKRHIHGINTIAP